MSIIHWIGIDDHADSWHIAHFRGQEQKPALWRIEPGRAGLRVLLQKLKALDGEVRVAYEAGPCGFALYRDLTKAGIHCEVAAPSLTPRKPGERVINDKRDAIKIARSYRSGDLTMIWVPDKKSEALRDLIRGRQAAHADLGRTKRQILSHLLRYGHRFRDGQPWTNKHRAWLASIELEGEDSRWVLAELVDEMAHREQRLAHYNQMVEEASKRPEYAAYVGALRTLRGIDTLSAMVLLSELGDLRRFPHPSSLMKAVGLVPGEITTGENPHRLGITKCGNARVRHIAVEAAWHYQKKRTPGKGLMQRRKGQPAEVIAIAEKCQARLNKRFYRMTARRKKSTITAVAVARELIGFIWAIGQVVHP